MGTLGGEYIYFCLKGDIFSPLYLDNRNFFLCVGGEYFFFR